MVRFGICFFSFSFFIIVLFFERLPELNLWNSIILLSP
ncbi:hypothetical protein LEP1GSC029_2878 [Leptospira interrogans str. 2002000626]|uniref:Uncharacterized protein n=2 Tax=Leptospira interrogans TaxID=173 RepID=A0A829DBQ0_LEPIR|nr:hypothetical protein LEP1GSC158_0696 [Leptospira interrogans serovar Zanoni str. LT2156]EMY06318.1 hypothetical protein LEP1GSC029_2878 [Leptospira interrogans str. 2002000626]